MLRNVSNGRSAAARAAQQPNQEVAELQARIASMEAQMEAVVGYLRHHESRLSEQRRALGDVANGLSEQRQSLKGVLQSRVWRFIVSLQRLKQTMRPS